MGTTTTDMRQTDAETEAGHIPNQETIDAILDSRKDDDETYTFQDVDSLFRWLDDEEN